MNNSAAISLEKVSKKYKLYDSPKDRLWEALDPFRKVRHKDFWALQDISLEILKGQTLGVIGRNGSGKSTLLQMLAGVLQPTSGAVTIHGEISPLLDLGAGFNPEFTGRENVLLQGVLRGFSQAEMAARLPAIEAFAEIGDFINQPMKVYSSGMFVRLAFSAAVHVDPDILIVDEALAVGDARFQRKCYRKFLEFQEQGKTIVFVSHDLGAILNHCQKAILLDNGRIVASGSPKTAVNEYARLLSGISRHDQYRFTSESEPVEIADQTSSIEDVIAQTAEVQAFLKDVPGDDHCPRHPTYNRNEYRYGDGRGRIVDFLVVSDGRYYPESIRQNSWIDIYVKVRYESDVQKPNYGVAIRTVDGVIVHAVHAAFQGVELRPVRRSDLVVYKFSLKMSVQSGDYFIGLGIGDRAPEIEDIALDRRLDLIHIRIEQVERFDGMVYLEGACREYQRQSQVVAGTGGVISAKA